MLASFILVGSWIPFMGDPRPGSKPAEDPTVADSPNNPTAASSSHGPHQAASPNNPAAASGSHGPHPGPMTKVGDVYYRLLDSLPFGIGTKFRREGVLEKIQYARLPCPLVIRYGQMRTPPGIALINA